MITSLTISGCSEGPKGATVASLQPLPIDVPESGNSTPPPEIPIQIGSGQEYFVAPNGTGGGSTSAPFGRIQDAINVANPGDTITILPGVYEEYLVTKRNGSSSSKITIRSRDGQSSVVIRKSGRVLDITHAHIQISDITVDGLFGTSDAIKINSNGDYTYLHKLVVKNSSRDCIDMDAPQNVEIHNSLIHHCLNPANGRTDAHGVVTGPVRNLVIKNSEIHTFSGDAFQVDPGRSSPGWNDVLIENCYFWLSPLERVTNGFAQGVVPGENAIDTKSSSSYERARITIKNSRFSGFQAGVISNMAALNLKENIEALVENVQISSSEIALRLRGETSSTPQGASVTTKNVIIFNVSTAVRYEDKLNGLIKLYHMSFGANINRFFQAASATGDPLVKNSVFLSSSLPSEANSSTNIKATVSDFENVSLHNYKLSSNSSILNSVTLLPDVTTDFDGNSRSTRVLTDAGAYHKN